MKKQNFDRALEIRNRIKILEEVEDTFKDNKPMYIEMPRDSLFKLSDYVKFKVLDEIKKEKESLEKEFEEL